MKAGEESSMSPVSSPRLVLVAGATGCLGRHVVTEFVRRGVSVRALSRRAAPGGKGNGAANDSIPGVEAFRGDVLNPSSLAGCCDGVDAVVSCIGGSLDLYAWRDRAPYSRVDSDGNLALLETARQAGAGAFVYVSVFGVPALEQTAYVKAHREVEQALATSGLDHRIVRPTGFFGFLDEVLAMARRGFVPLIGDGSARTNPVDERDLAEAVVGALDSPARVIEIGGPDVLSRAGIASLAAEASGRRVRVLHSSPRAWTAASTILGRLQPRLAQLLEFAAAVSTNDAIAPGRGRRRLEDYFREQSGRAA